jgi:phosphotransferase system HPr (HPr) family protein
MDSEIREAGYTTLEVELNMPRFGLVARPSTKLADKYGKCGRRIYITNEDRTADIGDVIKLLMLLAEHGTKLQIKVEGTDQGAEKIAREIRDDLSSGDFFVSEERRVRDH